MGFKSLQKGKTEILSICKEQLLSFLTISHLPYILQKI